MSPDVAASVRTRLLADARRRGEEFERTLTRYAVERLLYRLGASPARDRCLLKGASMLSVWLAESYRATRDVDLLAFGLEDEASVRELVGEICGVPCPEDGLEFDLSELRVEAIRAEEEYAGLRARFRARLGTARIAVQVDFGVGDALVGEQEEIDYPTLLETVPPPRVRAYSRETTVAEKFEAMVKLDTRNSRMKDFHDVWALSERFEFAGLRLRRAVEACFERRGTPWGDELPRPLTSAFYDGLELQGRWRGYLASGAVLAPPPGRFEVVGERVRQFLGPVRESIVEDRPFAARWPARGPWRGMTSLEEGDHGDV